jgi:hypothetical protein
LRVTVRISPYGEGTCRPNDAATPVDAMFGSEQIGVCGARKMSGYEGIRVSPDFSRVVFSVRVGSRFDSTALP